MFNQFLYKLPIAKVIVYSIIVFIEYAELKLLSKKAKRLYTADAQSMSFNAVALFSLFGLGISIFSTDKLMTNKALK